MTESYVGFTGRIEDAIKFAQASRDGWTDINTELRRVQMFFTIPEDVTIFMLVE